MGKKFVKEFLTEIEKDSPILSENDSKKTIFQMLKSNILELILTMSIQGIPNIFRSKYLIMKLIWFFCVMIGIAYTIYNIILSIFDYLQYDVNTSFRIVNEIPTEFPVITICDRDVFKTSFAFDYLTNYALSNNKKLENLTMSEINSINLPPQYKVEEKKKFGYSIEDILISCSFSGRSCSKADFDLVYHPFYGNCFAFNSKKNSSLVKKSNLANSKGGLELEIFLGVNKNLEQFSTFTGALLSVSNSSFKQRLFQTINVETGKETNIILKKTFLNQLPKPYSNCDFDALTSSSDSVLYRNLVENNYSYNQQDCYIQCYQKAVEEYCSCFFPAFLPFKLKIPCNNSNWCPKILLDKFFSNQIPEYNQCNNLCPLECKKTLFSYQISSSGYLSKKHAELKYMNNSIITSKFVDNKLTYDDIKSGIIILNIYYDDLSYIEVTESVKINENQFISNIGGSLGLCVGMSVLSFIEIFEIFFEIFMIGYRHLTNKINPK